MTSVCREVMEPGGPQEEEPERKKPGAPEHGLWLRDCAPGECLPDIVARLAEMKSAAEEGRGVFAERLRQSREMRDPGLFDTLVGHWGLNQTCSTIPADVWDPNAMDARNTLAGLLEVSYGPSHTRKNIGNAHINVVSHGSVSSTLNRRCVPYHRVSLFRAGVYSPS